MNIDPVNLLRDYIRIDTTNPPGNEHLAASFFGKLFDGTGIGYKTYETAPGRVSIRAEITGSGQQPPLILLHHMDVVVAKREDWSFDPFGGDIIDNHICGRGALDTKGLGIMQLFAFLEYKKSNRKPNRDIVFLATADEESGADFGVERLLNEHIADFKAGLVLNEGHYVVKGTLPHKLLATISPAEKGPCWLRLKRRGLGGHGSTPHGNHAVEKMVIAIERLTRNKYPPHVTPIAAAYFKKLAPEWDIFIPYLEDNNDETLLKIIENNDLFSSPQINAMLRNTISLNVINAGSKVNVIPPYIEAQIDCRLLPGENREAFIESVRKKLDDPKIEIEPISLSEGSYSSIETDSYKTIENVLMQHYPDAVTVPYLMLGGTDSRFFRMRGIPAYGFNPAVVTVEDLKSVHGVDEKIAVSSLLKGCETYTDIVKSLCQ